MSCWVCFNVVAEAVCRGALESLMLLRYEDFVVDPDVAVRCVLELVGEPPAASLVRGSEVVLGTNHTVAGNPDRFRTGTVQIREDYAWRTGLSRRLALEVTAMALPLLSHYGYDP